MTFPLCCPPTTRPWPRPKVLALLLALIAAAQGHFLLVAADWPMLHANARHDGHQPSATVNGAVQLAWVRHFPGDRLGTAMEPIVAGDRVFVATYGGALHALGIEDGRVRWRFISGQPFLHSPAHADGLVVAADAAGRVFGLRADSGTITWIFADDSGGFAAAPVIDQGTVLLGSRGGQFLALDVATGGLKWRADLAAPIRQTAAASDGRVFVTAEDLRVHAFTIRDGSALWTTPPLPGQSARDYYPIVVGSGPAARLIVRTAPAINMARRIAVDRSVLTRNAGIDDSDWKKVDAWIKSEAARGTPDLWEKEQAAVVAHLEADPQARSFHVIDPADGRLLPPPPVLWVGGCQGVGVPPAVTADGRLLVIWRSAYGNWNLGVAPLVSLGLLDLAANRIAPLFHQHGKQPAWNTFWGTADEAQNLALAGSTAVLVHQGTLASFDLRTQTLQPLWGNRDTFGGFRNPPWARNEWHGPARGAVAIANNRIFWLTGSRLLCLAPGRTGPAASDTPAADDNVPVTAAPAAPPKAVERLRAELVERVREVLSTRWAPLCVEPGLAGREFFFADSSSTFAALARAFPHLPPVDRDAVRQHLAAEWERHPPATVRSAYPLDQGRRREWHDVPPSELVRLGHDKPPHPFGQLPAALLYAGKLDEWNRVTNAWPEFLASFRSFVASGWSLDGGKGDLHANRYLAALLRFSQLAGRVGDTGAARESAALAETTAGELWSWWRRAAEPRSLAGFNGSAELDPFIRDGDALSFRVAPHHHKIALFHDLTQETAIRLRENDPEPFLRVWQSFSLVYPAWHLVGGERQVHFGENLFDPPDLALDAFQTLAWLRDAPGESLAARVDLPFCRADLFHIAKLAIALDRMR